MIGEITDTRSCRGDTQTLALSFAAAELARLPRPTKKVWTGWIGKKHMQRDDRVVVPGGQVRRIFGAIRGQVIVLKDPISQRGLPAEIFRAEDLMIYKNPYAVLLGRAKRGVNEIPSTAKREACRRNARMPPRPGQRPRGRPRASER